MRERSVVIGWFLTLSFMAVADTRPSVEWVKLNQGTVFCRRASETFIMRDTQACGSGTVFCSTPMECFWGFGGKSSGMVSCKARRVRVERKKTSENSFAAASSIVVNGPDMVCPGLQECADDPFPEVLTEDRMGEFTDGVVRLDRATLHAAGTGPQQGVHK